MERALYPILLGLCLLLAGCQADTDSPQACRHGVSIALSQAQWERALDLLASSECRTAFTPEEQAMNYAAAYTGTAGFDMPDLADKIIRHSHLSSSSISGERLLRLFVDFRPQWNSLTDLLRAQRHHTELMAAYEGLAPRACRRENLPYLSRLQTDACFYFGLVAIVQGLSAFSLLIPEQLEEWLDGRRGDCALDNNQNRIPDEAEATACAIEAADALDIAVEGRCSTPGGATVHWERLPTQPEVSFHSAGRPVAQVVPLRVGVQPGGACERPSQRVRLLETGRNPSLVLSAGYCRSTAISERCDAADPEADCWPCPVLLPDQDSLSAHKALLESLNRGSEALFAMLPEADVPAARAELDALKSRMCAYVADSEAACSTNESGAAQINLAALRQYLLQQRQAFTLP